MEVLPLMLTDGNFTPADADYIYLICEAKQPFLHSHLISKMKRFICKICKIVILTLYIFFHYLQIIWLDTGFQNLSRLLNVSVNMKPHN